MKKVWLILGVVVAIVALGIGMTSAFAQGNGNGGTVPSPFCDEWLLGEIVDKAGSAEAGNITLLAKEVGEVTIAINSQTKYKAWMAPWQEVTFDSLDEGDWIAVCLKDGVAKVVILLEAPQKPFHLKLEGNVTAVNGNVTVLTVDIEGGGNCTIALSGVDVDLSGAGGQPVSLTIGEYGPPLWRHYLGLQLGGVLEKFRQGFENWQGQGVLEKFRQGFENWQGQGVLEKFRQGFENWQGQGVLERFRQGFENWQGLGILERFRQGFENR